MMLLWWLRSRRLLHVRMLLRRRVAALRGLRTWLRLWSHTLGRLRRGSLLWCLLSRVSCSICLVSLLGLLSLLSLLLRLLLCLSLLHSNELLLLQILRLSMGHLLLQVHLHVHGSHIRVGLHRSDLGGIQRLRPVR